MLSIIIPVYNRAELVLATLDSIRHQSRTDWECILVDDHSTDETVSVIEKYIVKDSRFRLFRRIGLVKGPSACRNEGFRESRGDYIYFFDSDDILGTKFIETFLPYLEHDTELDYLNIRFARFRDTIEHCYRSSPIQPKRLSILEALAARRLSHATVSFIWRRSLLESQQELWNPLLFRNEDRELAFRLVSQAKYGLHVPKPILCFYRKHDSELRTDTVPPKKIMEMLHIVLNSMVESCLKAQGSPLTERYLARYIVRGMKSAIQYRAPEYGELFYQLKEKLQSGNLTNLWADVLRFRIKLMK